MFRSLFNLITLASITFAQAPAHPAFVGASVKPSGTPGGPAVGAFRGGPGTPDPERINGRMTIQQLLRQAYGVDFDQIQGPSWIAEEKYEILAKLPPGITKDDLKLMLQDLLAERFKLTLHKIKKDFPVYELTIAKGGQKIRENTNPKLEPIRPGDPTLPPDKDGFPQLAPGKSGMASNVSNGLILMNVQGQPLSGLLSLVSSMLGIKTAGNTSAYGRTIDKTGLTGRYDFKIEYSLIGSGIIGGALLPDSADPSGGPTIIDAMEKQLGLKLTETKAPYEVLVIDHVEKMPTEN